MDFPHCPVCKNAQMVPFSEQTLWVCLSPECNYTVSEHVMEVTYHKGFAGREPVEKKGKKYTTFNF